MSDPKKENRYKDTLNLPKTDFPQQANLVGKEKGIQDEWFAPGGVSDLLHVCNCGVRKEDDPGWIPCRIHHPIQRDAWEKVRNALPEYEQNEGNS